MMRKCCNRKEVTCFKLLSQDTIEKIRTNLYSLSETEQTQFILNYMWKHCQGDKSVLYTVGGQCVCEICFRMAYGFRYNRFSVIKAKFEQGVILTEHGRLGKSEQRNESIRVVSWLRNFVNKVGDRMPSSSEIHLPACLTKTDVYLLATEDLSQGGLKICGVSTFYNIWKSNFPNVKIPKVVIACLKCINYYPYLSVGR